LASFALGSAGAAAFGIVHAPDIYLTALMRWSISFFSPIESGTGAKCEVAVSWEPSPWPENGQTDQKGNCTGLNIEHRTSNVEG